MTMTTQTPTQPATGATGRVARVIGPVVDVEFAADEMPDINNKLLIEIETQGRASTIAPATHRKKRPSAPTISGTRCGGGSSSNAAGRRQKCAKAMPPTQTAAAATCRASSSGSIPPV